MCYNPSFVSKRITRRRVVQVLGASPLLTGGLLVACGTAPSTASPFTADPSIPTALAPGGELEQFTKQLADKDQFSGTLLVAKGDKPALLKAYGMANKEKNLPNRPDTIYITGSLAKSFTGVAIAQLAGQGKLTFTDPLGKHLDGFPAEIAEKVTIHQMLTHTSGMGDFHKTPNFQEKRKAWKSGAETMDGLLALIRQLPLSFSPGTSNGYSNSAYVVLGGIVAQVSGMDYYDYIAKHIFEVAGMNRSGFYTTPQREEMLEIAHNYSSGNGGKGQGRKGAVSGQRIDVTERADFIGTPSGGAYLTVEDQLRFCQALLGHRLLNSEFTETLMMGKVLSELQDWHQSDKFAYGVTDGLLNDQRIIWKSGGSNSSAAIYQIYPELGWTSVIISNYDGSDEHKSLVRKVEELITQQA